MHLYVFYRAAHCMQGRYMLRQFSLSVLPSVTLVHCVNMAEHIVKLLLLLSHIRLVFVY